MSTSERSTAVRLARRFAVVALSALVVAGAAGCDRGSLNGAGGTPGVPDRAHLVAARVVRIADGDSFEARLADGRRSGVRIGGIDAPERRQAWADRARRNLHELIGTRPVWLEIAKTDRYGRLVAHVFVASGDAAGSALVDVGHAQVAAGWAWFYRRYAEEMPPSRRGRYDAAERDAQRLRLGLWRDPEPIPPWVWRQRHPRSR
ncbi:MAG: thermonuclease family protein [Lautropia sp.]